MSTPVLDVPEALLRKADRFAMSQNKTLSEFVIEFLEQSVEEKPLVSEYGTPEEIHAALHGPTRTAKESDAVFRKKYNIPDELYHLSPGELAEQMDAIIEGYGPEKRAELERLGLL